MVCATAMMPQALTTSSSSSKAGFKTVGIGGSARSTLVKASAERRVVVGLTNAIRSLMEEPHRYLFCFMATPQRVDSGTHMQEVLLEAFCFEHGIYIIKVDNADKLSRLLGAGSAGNSTDLASYVLVRKSLDARGEECFSRSENLLIDHCEFYWDEPAKPVIKLPEK